MKAATPAKLARPELARASAPLVGLVDADAEADAARLPPVLAALLAAAEPEVAAEVEPAVKEVVPCNKPYM